MGEGGSQDLDTFGGGHHQEGLPSCSRHRNCVRVGEKIGLESPAAVTATKLGMRVGSIFRLIDDSAVDDGVADSDVQDLSGLHFKNVPGQNRQVGQFSDFDGPGQPLLEIGVC